MASYDGGSVGSEPKQEVSTQTDWEQFVGGFSRYPTTSSRRGRISVKLISEGCSPTQKEIRSNSLVPSHVSNPVQEEDELPSPVMPSGQVNLCIIGSSHVSHLKRAWVEKDFELDGRRATLQFIGKSGADFDSYGMLEVEELQRKFIQKPDVVVTLLGGNAITIHEKTKKLVPSSEVVGQMYRFYRILRAAVGQECLIIACDLPMRYSKYKDAPSSHDFRIIRDKVNLALNNTYANCILQLSARTYLGTPELRFDHPEMTNGHGVHFTSSALNLLENLIKATVDDVLTATRLVGHHRKPRLPKN